MSIDDLQIAAKLEAAGSWSKLLEHGKSWTVRAPRNMLAWQAYGDGARKTGHHVDALAAYSEALRVAPAEHASLVGMPVTAAPIHYRIAQVYVDQGNMDAAVREYQRAVELDPGTSVLWYDLGVALWHQGNKDGAFQAFRKAVVLEPTNVSALHNLGICYAIADMKDGVDVVYSRMQALDGKAANSFIALARQHLSSVN
jgi:tetratricopeptide (TPR) repeat protein